MAMVQHQMISMAWLQWDSAEQNISKHRTYADKKQIGYNHLESQNIQTYRYTIINYDTIT